MGIHLHPTLTTDSFITSILGYFIVGEILLLVLLLSPVQLVKRVLSRNAALLSLFFFFVVGSVLLVLTNVLDISWMFLVSTAILGVGLELIMVMWGEVLSTFEFKQASALVPLVFCLATLVDVLLLLMPDIVRSIVVPFLPSLSFLFLASFRFSLTKTAFKRSEKPLESHKLRGFLAFGLPVAFLLTVGAFNFASGVNQFMYQPGAENYPYSGVLFQTIRGVSAALFLLLTLVFKFKVHFVYRVGFLIMIAGYVLLPVASFLLRDDLARVMTMFGFTICDIFFWLGLIVVIRNSAVVRIRILLFAVFIKHLALLLGLIASIQIGSHSAIINPISTTLGYILVVLTVFLLSDNQGLWNIIKYGSSVAGTDEQDSTNLNHKVKYLTSVFELSQREQDVLKLLLQGRSFPRISQELFVSVNTVRTHARNIYKKTGVHSRQDLIDISEEWSE